MFPTVVVGDLPHRERDVLPRTAARMTSALQSHLRVADLPTHVTMHIFRLGGAVSKSPTGTPVDKSCGLGLGRRRPWRPTTLGPLRVVPDDMDSYLSTSVRLAYRLVGVAGFPRRPVCGGWPPV